MPPPVKLSAADVERLIIIVPELAKSSAGMRGANPMAPGPGAQPGPQNVEELRRVEALLAKHGTTFPDFFMQLTTLIATYFVLQPAELDKMLPSEKSAEARRILDDPAVAAERKQALREQIARDRGQADTLRTQLATLATADNKKVVKPYLAKIKAALEAAEAISKAAAKEKP